MWDHRAGLLSWVDILGELVHHTDPETGVTRSVPVAAPVGALALLGDSDHLLAIGNGFATLSGSTVGPVTEAFPGNGKRMNDGSVDAAGRFLAGSMGDGQAPVGSLYARDTDGGVRSLFDGVTISNGIAWSADAQLMYYVDSALQSVDVFAYDLDTGAVSNRRTLVEISEEAGTPDGITIDAEDCIWVALWDGGSVRRYAPDGRLLAQISVPAPRVTSCAFGGPDLDHLFITTAAVGVDRDDYPHAGALFVTRPDVEGVVSPVVPESR